MLSGLLILAVGLRRLETSSDLRLLPHQNALLPGVAQPSISIRVVLGLLLTHHRHVLLESKRMLNGLCGFIV